MGGHSLFHDLTVLVFVSIVTSILFARLKLPAITGLLAAGMLAGPHGLGLVEGTEPIEHLAEFGVILLLFTIGLEFSLKRLLRIWFHVALGGVLQVGATVLAAMFVAKHFGFTQAQGIYLGCVFALSSTALIFRALSERRELEAPHGRLIVGTLVFQDLCVVPMVLLVPVLAHASVDQWFVATGTALGKAALTMAGTLLLARLWVPKLFYWVDRTRSSEIFAMAVLGICIGTAWITSQVGLSFALGAFLAGIVLADSDFQHRAMADALPLRGMFSSLFFVSLGMLFNVQALLKEPTIILGLFLALLVGKGIIATGVAMILRFPARAAWLTGVALAQFGEFGFVLLKLGQFEGLVDPALAQLLLNAGVLSMLATPMVVALAPHITAGEKLLRPLERIFGTRSIDEATKELEKLSGHIVIVGFGVAGRVLAGALRKLEIPYIVFELNAETVRNARAQGEPIYYGDITSTEVMEHSQLRRAQALVLLINDPAGAQRAIACAHQFAPTTPLLLRCRYSHEKDEAMKAGATAVVVDEIEAGIETLAKVFRQLGLPRNVLAPIIDDVRIQTLPGERAITLPRQKMGEMADLAELKIERFLVRPQSFSKGHTVRDLRLHSKTGALIVTIRRNEVLLEMLDSEMAFQPGDIIYLVGSSQAVQKAVKVLDHGSLD